MRWLRTHRSTNGLTLSLAALCSLSGLLTPAAADPAGAGTMHVIQLNRKAMSATNMLWTSNPAFASPQGQAAQYSTSAHKTSGQGHYDCHRIVDRTVGITDAFASEIESALGLMPDNCLAALDKRGYRVSLCPRLTDAVPGTRNQQVRGYEPSATWNSVYGMFNRTTKTVVMAELAEQPDNGGKTSVVPLEDHKRRQGIVKHECGHAIDQMLGGFSHSSEFMKIYEREAKTFSERERSDLSYFLQRGYAGAEETFAELFACLNGDACDHDQDVTLCQHFTELQQLIKAKVASIR